MVKGLSIILIRSIIAVCILFMFSTIRPNYYRSQYVPPKKNQVMCICIPKCGTHLLIKCLTLFDIPGIYYPYKQDVSIPSQKHLKKIRQLNKLGPPHHYKGKFYLPEVSPMPKIATAQMRRAQKKRSFWCHWPYTQQFAHFLGLRTKANFLLIRDPRDMVVSFAHMIATSRDGSKADVSEIIADLITGQQKYFVPWATEIQEAYPLLWEFGLYNFYSLYFRWLNQKKFMLVRFEDLIGSAGGGSVEKQMDTIRLVARHIGHDLSQQKLNDVINNLFGGTATFREGKSAGWKKHFTPEIKALFQQDTKLMQLLVDFGYEKDFSW